MGPDALEPDRPTSLPAGSRASGAGQVVVDLVYHPASTPWLRAAQDRGAITHNGLGMLVHQAAAQLRPGRAKNRLSLPCGRRQRLPSVPAEAPITWAPGAAW